MQQRQRRPAERERFPVRQESVSLRHRRSDPTWENGLWHSGSLRFADTEEVTDSNPVAPTPCLTNVFTSAGCRTCAWPSAPPPPAQTSQRPRRHLLGTYEAKTDAVQALPAGPRRFCRTELVESPELVQEQARRLKAHSPTKCVCSQRWGLGPRRPMALRTEQTHHLGSAQDRGNAHPGLRVGGTAQPISTVRLNQE